MTRNALLATAFLLLVACDDRSSSPQASPSPPRSPNVVCGGPTEGCLIVEVDDAKQGDRLYTNMVKYGLPEGPPSLARPIRLSPGGRYSLKLPPGEYGLLVYRQEVEPTPGEGPECQLNFSIEKRQSIALRVAFTNGGGCSVGPGSGSFGLKG